jgi:murein DD-endopeptidase MepM/ murein hydrolase activator NlpD
VLREAVFREAGHITYYRRSRFERLPDVTIRLVIGPDGRVLGGSVRPTQQPAVSAHLDYRTKAKLRLPFLRPAQGGRWYVGWGGREAIDNYHVVAPDQRYAYDFLVTRGEAVAAGKGERNEEHFCWNEPVVAPAAGRVAVSVDEVEDNERPGAQRPDVPPPGNHVVIDHGQGEYSLIAHFRRGTVAVRRGEQVRQGQLLGRCGNSGRSSMPHVHYHLQTGAAYSQGVGLPAFFTNYRADDAMVGRGEPVRGQRLLPGR